MKVKKRLMIALAGAMILGVFGTSGAPMMVSASSSSDYILKIPAELSIQEAGMHEVGKIYVTVGDGAIIIKTNDYAEYGDRTLVNENDTSQEIPYVLFIQRDLNENPMLLDNRNGVCIFNTDPDSGLVELPIFADIEMDESDLQNMMPGVYSDEVIFTVGYQLLA